MAEPSGVQKLIAAVRRKHPKLPQLPAHPATKRAPRPVVARYRLHAAGAPPAGTTDKMLSPIVNNQTMKGWAKAKKPKKRAKATARAVARPAPVKIEVEIELTVNGKKHTAKAARVEQED